MTPIKPLTPIMATSTHSHHSLSRAPELKAVMPKISMVPRALNGEVDRSFEGVTVSTEVTPKGGLENVGNRCYNGRIITLK